MGKSRKNRECLEPKKQQRPFALSRPPANIAFGLSPEINYLFSVEITIP